MSSYTCIQCGNSNVLKLYTSQISNCKQFWVKSFLGQIIEFADLPEDHSFSSYYLGFDLLCFLIMNSVTGTPSSAEEIPKQSVSTGVPHFRPVERLVLSTALCKIERQTFGSGNLITSKEGNQGMDEFPIPSQLHFRVMF